MQVLFVCTGNICRSPIAERLFVEYAGEMRHRNVQASSAGTRAVVGDPIHELAVRVLQDLGGNPNEFAARQLTPKVAASADLILTMTRDHRDAVLSAAPQRLHRTFTLTEAARLVTECGARDIAQLSEFRAKLPSDATFDIPDPVGRNLEVFAAVGSVIANALPPVLTVCHGD